MYIVTYSLFMVIGFYYLMCFSLYVQRDKNNICQLILHMGKGLYEFFLHEYHQGEGV
jgi:hypothetical protein